MCVREEDKSDPAEAEGGADRADQERVFLPILSITDMAIMVNRRLCATDGHRLQVAGNFAEARERRRCR